MKKLYRSENDKVFAGIIGGVGEYFEVDPILLRLGFVVLVLLTGLFPGIIAYIIALLIVPKAPNALSTMVTPPPMEKPKMQETKKDMQSSESTKAPNTEIIKSKIEMPPEPEEIKIYQKHEPIIIPASQTTETTENTITDELDSEKDNNEI